ncbi:MAG: FAD-dependent oxidoreductase [Armatimonadia bacterium]|nr:FAD-dependent oxidoreductase [Armatimonadia bacterium]
MPERETVTIEEQVPVAGEWDVIVCGGGSAGIGAAIAAAGEGVSTLLVEAQQYLGGLATVLSTMCDTPGGPVYDELMRRLEGFGCASYLQNRERYYPPGRMRYRPQMFSAVSSEMVDGAGVDTLFGTIVEGAMVEDGAVRGVFLANKAGRTLARGKVIIDCTADADVAAAAGAAFVQGDPADGRTQHCNFRWMIGGVDSERFQAEGPDEAELKQICREAVADRKIDPPEALFGIDPEVFPFSDERGGIATRWELQHVDPTDPWQTSEALMQCHRAAMDIVRVLRKRVPGYEECVIARLDPMLGTRESRRIEGLYTVTREDVLAGRKFEDGAVPAWFWLDLHDPAPGLSTPYPLEFVQQNRPAPGDWYEIPYRCQVPREVDGLLVAGRCISCDRPAQGSLRVMPTCMYLGEAAGTAARWAVTEAIRPREVDGARLKRVLNEDYWEPPTYD